KSLSCTYTARWLAPADVRSDRATSAGSAPRPASSIIVHPVGATSTVTSVLRPGSGDRDKSGVAMNQAVVPMLEHCIGGWWVGSRRWVHTGLHPTPRYRAASQTR